LTAADVVPETLLIRVLAEDDPKGYQHYLLAQSLLSHLKYKPCDLGTLIDVNWDNSVLSYFGPQVIDRQVVLPPPPPKADVRVSDPNRTLFDNHDPQVMQAA